MPTQVVKLPDESFLAVSKASKAVREAKQKLGLLKDEIRALVIAQHLPAGFALEQLQVTDDGYVVIKFLPHSGPTDDEA